MAEEAVDRSIVLETLFRGFVLPKHLKYTDIPPTPTIPHGTMYTVRMQRNKPAKTGKQGVCPVAA